MLLWFRGEREKGDQEWVGWDGTILMERITQDLSGGGGGSKYFPTHSSHPLWSSLCNS